LPLIHHRKLSELAGLHVFVPNSKRSRGATLTGSGDVNSATIIYAFPDRIGIETAFDSVARETPRPGRTVSTGRLASPDDPLRNAPNNDVSDSLAFMCSHYDEVRRELFGH